MIVFLTLYFPYSRCLSSASAGSSTSCCWPSPSERLSVSSLESMLAEVQTDNRQFSPSPTTQARYQRTMASRQWYHATRQWVFTLCPRVRSTHVSQLFSSVFGDIFIAACLFHGNLPLRSMRRHGPNTTMQSSLPRCGCSARCLSLCHLNYFAFFLENNTGSRVLFVCSGPRTLSCFMA